MAYKRQTKEEKARMRRRRRRQLLGGVLCLLIVLGAASLVTAGVRLVGRLTDDTEERQEYARLLAPMVMLNPVPFDSLETADQNTLLQAAIWGAIYSEDLTQYERDEVGALILPVVDVDKNGARLFGSEFVLEHHTFDANGMQFVYDEERMGYIIPITGTTSSYTPEVVKIQTSVQTKRVTVGYVAPPTGFSLDGVLATERGEPAFYYDYIFTRQGDGYFLTAITTSEMKPETDNAASSIPLPPDLVENGGIPDLQPTPMPQPVSSAAPEAASQAAPVSSPEPAPQGDSSSAPESEPGEE